MRPYFKEEIVAVFEQDNKLYDLCVTAETDYDESKLKLVINLDRFLRLKDISVAETCCETTWLPKKSRVEYLVHRDEIAPTLDEVFGFWTEKVRASIPKIMVPSI